MTPDQGQIVRVSTRVHVVGRVVPGTEPERPKARASAVLLPKVTTGDMDIGFTVSPDGLEALCKRQGASLDVWRSVRACQQ